MIIWPLRAFIGTPLTSMLTVSFMGREADSQKRSYERQEQHSSGL
jgi:hypothetical protein